jgi:hypothetical protein
VQAPPAAIRRVRARPLSAQSIDSASNLIIGTRIARLPVACATAQAQVLMVGLLVSIGAFALASPGAQEDGT